MQLKLYNKVIMQLTLNLDKKQAYHIISQLSANQIGKIIYELSENNIEEKSKKEISIFQKFILSGPVMSDEQYSDFYKQRQHFNLWRTQ